MLALVELH